MKDEEMPVRGFEPKGNQFGIRDRLCTLMRTCTNRRRVAQKVSINRATDACFFLTVQIGLRRILGLQAAVTPLRRAF